VPIIALVLIGWVVWSVMLLLSRHGRPWRLIVGLQIVWLVAVVASSIAFLALGLGCFHCTGADVWVGVIIAVAVLLGIGFGGTAIARRFLSPPD
jgi:hypothetical protein